MSWGNSSEIFASIFNILLFSILTGYPFYVYMFFMRKKDVLKNEKVEESYGSLYENINTNSKMALMFNLIYLCRRMVFAVLSVYCIDYPNFQIQFMVLHSALVCMYILLVRPFETNLLNYQELFNEVCILGVSYHLFIFTDFVGDDDLQY